MLNLTDSRNAPEIRCNGDHLTLEYWTPLTHASYVAKVKRRLLDKDFYRISYFNQACSVKGMDGDYVHIQVDDAGPARIELELRSTKEKSSNRGQLLVYAVPLILAACGIAVYSLIRRRRRARAFEE